jgi:hypothetical protein
VTRPEPYSDWLTWGTERAELRYDPDAPPGFLFGLKTSYLILDDPIPVREVNMNDLRYRLTSRKLWVAVGGFITFVANKQYTEALAVALAFLGVEGAADIRSR